MQEKCLCCEKDFEPHPDLFAVFELRDDLNLNRKTKRNPLVMSDKELCEDCLKDLRKTSVLYNFGRIMIHTLSYHEFEKIRLERRHALSFSLG